MPRPRQKPAAAIPPTPFPPTDLCISLALLAAVLAIYLQTGQFEFLRFDDPEFVVNNLHLRAGLTPASVAWAFRTGYAANWFPLTWLSYMLGIELYGLSSGWHHLTNVFLHAANTVLLFALLRRLTGARWRSAFVAALFAVHPLHVEAVAWISERRELLSGLFWLLSIGAYLRYAARPRASAYFLLLLAFACGLMSKPMIVTLPFALLLLDYWPLRRWQSIPVRRLILEKAPLVVMAAIASAVTLLVQGQAGAASSLSEVPFPYRLENAVVSYAAYALQFFWPAKLAVLYPYVVDLPLWRILGAVAALAAITALAIAQRQRRPYLFVGWLWFAGILVPVIGLVQVGVQSRADRYMYIPLIGLALIVAWGLADIAASRFRTVAVALASVTCAVYGTIAWSTTADWRDTVTLFQHAVAVTQNNWAALNVLGGALLAANRPDDAIPYIESALRIRPGLADAHVNLGAALSKKGDFAGAAQQYRAALQSDPANTDGQEGLGVVMTEQGQFDQARAPLEAAARARSDDPDVHYNLGRLYGLSGHPDQAIPEFAETVRLQPQNAEAHFNLGAAYAARDELSQAADQFGEALRLNPDYLSARFNLAVALANLGRFDDAIAQFREVLHRRPDFPGAEEALRNCLDLKAQSAR